MTRVSHKKYANEGRNTMGATNAHISVGELPIYTPEQESAPKTGEYFGHWLKHDLQETLPYSSL